jgi:PAS domain S-box-containing protein
VEKSYRFGPDAQCSLQVLWEDGERSFARGWCLDADGQRKPVLAVSPTAEHPTPSNLERLAHEFGLKDELDGAWAVRPLELLRNSQGTMLLLEDPGGEPLARRLGTPMEVGQFLRLAIGIVRALGKTHQHGLVHKDLKPTNILVTGVDAEVRLTGFGLASRLRRERLLPEPPEELIGTLAYMSPEQTGRTNRSIDFRSDLYALGVTLYQTLTGVLPFTAADPMGWVHCHVARQPISPAERVKEVPTIVSAIIMKLLAKTAEERYQTARGLECDLQRCLAEWEARERIDAFQLGVHDSSDRLLIPERLYGRAREVEHLLAVFDRVVTTGAPELALLSGYSGIGKSSVVNELHKVLVAPRGLFASAKFDQHKHETPYETLAQAVKSLIRPLLGKSEARLAPWRDSLREALGPNGQLIVDLVPELKLIIGDQQPVRELPPQDAQQRFQLVVRRLIGVFARPEHPLALFLDDLQWLDAVTLDLLEDLLTRSDLQHLMLIGAYRDNEVTAANPLLRKLEAIKTAGGKVAEIRLAPLEREHLAELIADTLRCDQERAAPLAQLVHEKTGGNPFFANQFMSSLAEEGMLIFDHDAARWSWDLDRIHAKGYTENVVELMVGKLTRLPASTRAALQQLASLGNSADLTTLSIVLGTSRQQVHAALWPAVHQELIEHLRGTYRFVHDRIQEAAYSMVPDELRGETHLRMGRLLAARTPPEKREEMIFDIVNQLNRGAALITSREEREWLAELNLLAGRRARQSAAYSSALTYLAAGRALLPDGCLERCGALAFELEFRRAECEFVTGALAAADERLRILWERATNIVDCAAITCLRMDVYTTLGQGSRAVEVGLDYLRRVGIDWSPHPTEDEARRDYEQVLSVLGSRTIDELIELPLMSDPASLATMDVLNKMETPGARVDKNREILVVSCAVKLTLERGNCDGSSLAYQRLAIVAGARFGEYPTALKLGRVGYELVERCGLKRFQAGVYIVFGNLVMPWTQHVKSGRELVRRGVDVATRNGDVIYAAYGYANLIRNMLAAGDALAETQREADHGLEFARKVHFTFFIDLITAQLRLIRTLRGLTPIFGRFDDKEFDERQFEHQLSAGAALARPTAYYWIRKLQARFMSGDIEMALDASRSAHDLLWTLSHSETVEYRFCSALCHATVCRSATPDDRRQHLEAMTAHQEQLKVWANNCPENFEDRVALVDAEIAGLEGRELDAERLYEQAIRAARDNAFVQNEALAYELAARFYAARGFEQIAHLYLRDSRHAYLRWGADGKVRQLEQLHPHLRENERVPGPTTTIGAPIQHLDLATIIKVSQAVSGEIVLEKLIGTLVRTAIEQAGAQRGLLLLLQGEALRITAEATTDGDRVIVNPRDDVVTEDLLPESVLHYVLRMQETVILDDAAAQSSFAADPYIRQHVARSILCLPLINQAKLVGVLYLENNLAARVFAPARIAALTLLASQAAISLENTRLYRDLAEREAKIQRLVDANIIGIIISDLEGRILEANDAFLRMLGYDQEDLALGGLNRTKLTPAEWRDRDARTVAELKTIGIVQPFEKEYFRKDGSRVPVLMGGTLFDEKANQGVSFVLDLTERKRAEQELRASEERFRTLVQFSFDVYWESDAQHRFIRQEFAESVVDAPARGSELGKTRWEVPYLEPDAEAWRKHRETLDAHLPFRDFELARPMPDGGKRYVSVSGLPVFDENGRFTGYRGVGRHITERKQAEQALREAQTELAHVNRVTTMGQLTASIAHEVNQPIAAAVTNAYAALRWLRASPPDLEEVRQSLGQVIENGRRAGDVIDGIRALVKKAPPRSSRFDLNEAILDVIALTRSEVLKHGVALQTELATGLPSVDGDRVQLQQVILNLIMNAAEAMGDLGEERRELLISTRTDAAGGVLVAVRDSGPGLDPTSAHCVFEAFYTTKSTGLGMGLAICRSIIEAHGGRLWASANQPRGTVFQFTLPPKQAEAIPAE